MPYYAWQGITLEGIIKKGSYFARSIEDLKTQLLQQEIGFIKARQKNIPYRLRIVSMRTKIEIMHNFTLLLKAQIRLHTALIIISQTCGYGYVQYIFNSLASEVAQGVLFSKALSMHGDFFDEFTQMTIAIAEKTGNIAQALENLLAHIVSMQEFRKKIYQALWMPILTFCFFIIILLGVLVFFIPHLMSFFSAFDKQIPAFTQMLFNISLFMHSYSALYMFILLSIASYSLWLMSKTQIGKKYMSSIFFNIPGIRSFLHALYTAYFLHTLAFLLSARVSLLQALQVLIKNERNYSIKYQIAKILYAIEAGTKLSDALDQSYFASRELQALVSVGESSGQLAIMLEQAGKLYQQRVYRTIHSFSVLIQPLLLVGLGCFIAALIFAVYMPLLTLNTLI